MEEHEDEERARYTMRRGPLVIYKEDNGISRAFRGIPGVDLACARGGFCGSFELVRR